MPLRPDAKLVCGNGDIQLMLGKRVTGKSMPKARTVSLDSGETVSV